MERKPFKIMRKITKESVQAFVNATPFSKSNVTIQVLPNVTIYSLFGNPIAYLYNDPKRTLLIDNCGYNTVTTSDRLKAILQELGIGYTSIKQGEMYLTLYKVGTFVFDKKVTIVDGKNID